LKVLYITYDGLTDPLGQSQIIPYLKGLAEAGHEIIILSAEKKSLYKEKKQSIAEILNPLSIKWIPVFYSSNPKVLSTIFDILKLKCKSRKIYSEQRFNIVHCRSYIPSLVGLWLKKKYGVRFLFDMRGFWADERIDGKIWNIKNLFFQLIFNYFKKKEKEFLLLADGIISLTDNGKKEIQKWPFSHLIKAEIKIIPCCVDTDHFDMERIDQDMQNNLRKKLKITSDDFIVSYLGSIGTWYMLDEMLHFFKRLLLKVSNAKFFFITTENPAYILKASEKYQINANRIIIAKASRKDVPLYLSLSDLSIFFIKPVFSKRASSPTKQAEVMSMGIPIICNAGVGDTDEIIKGSGAGILIQDFDPLSIDNAIMNLDSVLNIPKNKIRKAAINNFSLKSGIERYIQIYESFNPD